MGSGTIRILLFLIFSISVGRTQQLPNDTLQVPKLVLKALSKKEGVYLRWGVDDKWAWKYGLQYGYVLERITIFRDGEPLAEPEKKVITGGPIKPKPLNEWETLIQENDMAAVAAQALYGDSFNVNNENESLLMQVIYESDELEQRFGFSMFAVDQDFKSAEYAGLGIVDTDVRSNERYLYRLRMAAPKEIIQAGETGLLIAPSEEVLLPKPYDFSGFFYNNAFVLVWEYDALLDFYTAYDLERSEDGVHFSKINEAPITKLTITKVSGISYTDSIPQYGKKYWYRIRGRSLFDETGPASDAISIIGFKQLLTGPETLDCEIISEKEAILTWNFPEDEAWKLTGFNVLRSERAIGPYQIIQENIPKEARKIEYQQLGPINYFKVRALGIAGDYQDSSPLMVQPLDSIPPEKPVGLAGTVDTLGIVQISWKPNKELDLKGYTVLRADRFNQEFTKLTKWEINEAQYRDTVNLQAFNEKVYYQVIASDNRYNESPPSDTLVLERPNRIPPTSPVFKSYQIKGDTIFLSWIPSSSPHLSKQIVYRKILGTNKEQLWEAVFETDNPSLAEFKDLKYNPNTRYSYVITAVNQNNLESKPSPPLTLVTPKTLLRPKIKGLFAEVDREKKYVSLSWRYNIPDVVEVKLYKKTDETNFGLYKIFAPDVQEFKDGKVNPNTNYTYGMKAIFVDGSESEWNEISINF